MSDLSNGSTVSSSNSTPLNQSTVSKPTRPPEAITRNRSPARSGKCAGVRRACSSIRVNMCLGSRPTSSANMHEDEPVDEVRDRVRVVTALPQRLRDRREEPWWLPGCYAASCPRSLSFAIRLACVPVPLAWLHAPQSDWRSASYDAPICGQSGPNVAARCGRRSTRW